MSLVPTSSAFRFILVFNLFSVFSIGFAVASTRICIIHSVKLKIKQEISISSIFKEITFNLFRMPPCWDVGTPWYLHRLYTVYTAHVHSTACILHIQHVNTIRYHLQIHSKRFSIKQQIHRGHFRCALQNGHRNLIRNPRLTGENFVKKWIR